MQKMGMVAPTATKTGTTIAGVVFKARLASLRGLAQCAKPTLMSRDVSCSGGRRAGG